MSDLDGGLGSLLAASVLSCLCVAGTGAWMVGEHQ